jgi:hypothetical protein
MRSGRTAYFWLLGNSRYKLMMDIYAEVATLFAVSGPVTVIDEQHRAIMGQRLRSRDSELGVAAFVSDEVVRFRCAIERSKADRLLVKVILEQAVVTAGAQVVKLRRYLHLATCRRSTRCDTLGA